MSNEIEGIVEVIHVMDSKTYDALLALATIVHKHDKYCGGKLDLLINRMVECTVNKGMIEFPEE